MRRAMAFAGVPALETAPAPEVRVEMAYRLPQAAKVAYHKEIMFRDATSLRAVLIELRVRALTDRHPVEGMRYLVPKDVYVELETTWYDGAMRMFGIPVHTYHHSIEPFMGGWLTLEVH